ncbi:MAG: RNA polymerase sigma factor [Phycisphaerales bacterium]
MTAREERILIARVLDGDRAAAEALVRAHQPSLYAFMLRIIGKPEVAEDVVQEAFVRALTHLERYDNRFRFSTWLFTIAKRLYVNANQRLTPAFDTDFVATAPAHRLHDGAPLRPIFSSESCEDTHRAIETGLAALSADQREAIILFYQLDWPIDQISAYLDQPEGTIKSHLHRARARMRAAIEASEVLAPRVREILA